MRRNFPNKGRVLAGDNITLNNINETFAALKRSHLGLTKFYRNLDKAGFSALRRLYWHSLLAASASVRNGAVAATFTLKQSQGPVPATL